MTFKRIDDSTIRCIVTEEDLVENGLELDDFFTQSDKAQDFLRDIVEQAALEVGYETHQGMVSLQLMPLPNHALAITFSESASDSLSAVVENIKGMLQDVKDKAAGKGVLQDGDALHREEETGTIAKLPAKESEKQTKSNTDGEGQQKEAVNIRVFAFVSLRNFRQFACAVNCKNPIPSTLYLDEEQDIYYLILEKGRLSARKFNVMCTSATEFGTYIANGEQMISYLEEHAQCILEQRAVKVMAKL